MKAAVYREFGPPEVLKLAEIEKPIPGADEVLILLRRKYNEACQN